MTSYPAGVYVKGYGTNYLAFMDGRIFSTYANRWLKQGLTQNGYARVSLCYKGKVSNHYVHRLIAETFIPNETNLPCVNHIDNNRVNNNSSNLEWCTHQQNTAHMVNQGRNYTAAVRKKLTHCAKGHELSLENSVVRANGDRRCKECKNAYERRKRAEQRDRNK